MLEQWEVERALAWRRRASKVASKSRLLGSPEFTAKAAAAKLAAIADRKPREWKGNQFIGGRVTCAVSTAKARKLPREQGELF